VRGAKQINLKFFKFKKLFSAQQISYLYSVHNSPQKHHQYLTKPFQAHLPSQEL